MDAVHEHFQHGAQTQSRCLFFSECVPWRDPGSILDLGQSSLHHGKSIAWISGLLPPFRVLHPWTLTLSSDLLSQVLEAPSLSFPQPLTPMKLCSQSACWLPPMACITAQVYRDLKQWCHKDYRIHTPFYKTEPVIQMSGPLLQQVFLISSEMQYCFINWLGKELDTSSDFCWCCTGKVMDFF